MSSNARDLAVDVRVESLQPKCPLTPVEIQALRLLAAGLTHQEIAERENVGSTAITNRVNRAGRKLGTVTATQTVVTALLRGYLNKPPYVRR